MTIKEMLDQLADLRAARDSGRLQWEEKRDGILAPVKAELNALDAEFEPMMAEVEAKAAKLEGVIKEAVLQNAASVKGQHLHAVWSKGRVTWDGKLLDGLMIAVPQLATARKEGEPSVSIWTI